MHKNKITNILNLSPDDRLDYFIRKVCDFEEVWGLFNEGWAMSESVDGKKVISFWPEQNFASLCAIETWSGYEPKLIKLEDFTQKWLTGMEKDNVLVGVFQTPEDKAVVIFPAELGLLLSDELENYQ